MDKDAYISQLENKIQEMENRNKDAYTAQLETMVEKLQKQVDNLTEMLLLMRRQKFGSSSEKARIGDIDGQLNLFNEAEVEYTLDAEEPIVRDSEGYKHRKARRLAGKRSSRIFRFMRYYVKLWTRIFTVIAVGLGLSPSARKPFERSWNTSQQNYVSYAMYAWPMNVLNASIRKRHTF